MYFFFRTIQHKYVKLNADEDNLFGLVFNLTVIFYLHKTNVICFIYFIDGGGHVGEHVY